MKLLLSEHSNVRVIADSAIGRNSQPWFIPDSGANWRWRRALAYRVSKLGKSIASKYMGRYVDAMTLLWVAEADGFENLDYMDGAVVCGKWLPLAEGPVPQELADFTTFTTIKNGDILAMMLDDPSTPIIKNRHISLDLNNEEVISFNLK